MRRTLLTALLIPATLLFLACSSKLEKGKAEELLSKTYPVVVPVTVPEGASAEKGSPEALRLDQFKANLASTGWFDIVSTDAGSQETCTFRLKPGAPASIAPAPDGFRVPAAQAVFVRALSMEPVSGGARVTYRIRLANPTPQFPLFQLLHPDVALGATKDRHATFVRRGGTWELTGTDEVFQKAR